MTANVILGHFRRLPARGDDEVVVDFGNRCISRRGRNVTLPSMAFQCVALLLAAHGRDVDSKTLAGFPYLDDEDGGAVSLMKCLYARVCKARKALAPLGINIITHYGFGFCAEIQPKDDLTNSRQGLVMSPSSPVKQAMPPRSSQHGPGEEAWASFGE